MKQISKSTPSAGRRFGIDSGALERIASVDRGRSPDNAARSVKATVVNCDSTVEHILLAGADGERFNLIRLQLDQGSITAMSISDQDGAIAIGWIDADGLAKGLRPNKIASALADRLVVGRMVVTGPGRGEDDSMTSVPLGLQLVLDKMTQGAS